MKLFKLENLIKGLFLSLLGLTVMSLSVYGWRKDELTDIQAGGALTIGFALAFMRSKLDDMVSAFIKKFFNIDTKKDDPK